MSLVAHAEKSEAKNAPPTDPPISLSWVAETRSPQTAKAAPLDARFHALCGNRDLGLARVASAIVGRHIADAPVLSQRAIKHVARAAGVPYPFVAAWSVAGTATEPKLVAEETEKRLAAWLASRPRRGARRCGIARGMTASGHEVISVVLADTLAELSPVPTRTKVAKWLKLDATVHPSASAATVVLLGPRGRPKRVLASFDGGVVRSRFTLDQPGRWIVQVVANMPSGPQPVLEMEVFAGVDPPEELVDEQPSDTKHDARDLLSWLNAARVKEGLGTLTRNAKLDALARAHAVAMVRANRVAHDVGKGTPQERVAAAQALARRVGENVARAATVTRIHTVLWDSPSHRENMLDSSFHHVGIAAVKDETGRVWAVQLFADRL